MSFLIFRSSRRTPNEPADLLGVNFFQWLQPAIGIATNATDDLTKFVFDDMPTDVFVR